MQLFRERLSDNKMHATTSKGVVLSSRFSKKFERMAGEAVDIYLRVLKESRNSYSVRNIFNIIFRDCRVHIFSDNLSRNSCICI